ncbi:MAG TPA: NUDIX domain-containing protein [Tissierellia bacterium]|nr:NUDIX domain-containing protein [Tissierellia bacterium]
MEKFAKPAVGAIIEKDINGVSHILIQERYKKDDIPENGLIEIPAGKVRECENIFDALRREIWEETGLIITEIQGEKETVVCNCNEYMVISFNPFYSSQNLSGGYSIMLQTFICKATGELLQQSDESVNIRWISLSNLKTLLEENENTFYPMHINALKKYIDEN